MIMSFNLSKYFSSGEIIFLLFAKNIGAFIRNLDPHNNRLNRKKGSDIPWENVGFWQEFGLFESSWNIQMIVV